MIDTSSNSVLHTIGISPYGWPNCITIGSVSGTTYAYVTVVNADNTQPDFVLKINTSTYAISATISLGVAQCIPYGIAITPNGSYVYVACGSTDGYVLNGFVCIITTSSNAVSAQITFGTGYRVPWGIAITPDGEGVYVAISYGFPEGEYTTPGAVAYWSANGAVPSAGSISYVTVGTQPRGIAITPGSSPQMVYVANIGYEAIAGNDPCVSYFQTGGSTVGTIYTTTLSQPFGVAITPDGSRAYVADWYWGRTIVINTGPTPSSGGTISSTGGFSFGTFIQQNADTGNAVSEWFGC